MGPDVMQEVSVIIPTRNRAPVLARCLGALAEMSKECVPAEIIVIDDSSTDRTPEVVRQFAKTTLIPVVLLRQEQALGANAARNLGLQEARGEIITFIDDDVIVPPDWLEKLVNGLLQSGCAAVSGAVRLTVDGPIVGKHREEVGSFLGEILRPPSGARGEVVPVLGNMAVWRWVFESAQFDDAVRPPVEEGDWLRRAGVQAAFIPEAWVWHYKTPEELRLKRILPLAWRRGSETGRWLRERLALPSRERVPMVVQSLITCGRGLGHAIARQCWGGIVISLGEFARALALLGLVCRDARAPKSWR